MSGNGIIGGFTAPTYKTATGCWRPSKIAREQLSSTARAAGAQFPVLPDPSYSSTTGLWQFVSCSSLIYPDTSSLGSNSATQGASGFFDTTRSVFSNTSLRAGGSAGAASIGSNAGFNFGTGDFTVEGWLYPNGLSGTKVVVDMRIAADGFKPLVYWNGSALIYHLNGATRITGTGALTNTTWQHWHLSRISSVTQLGVAGAQVGSNYSDANTYIQSALIFGADVSAASAMTGWFGPHRVTKGVGRYSGTYTVPNIFPEY